jgi:hypothetical protein
LDSICKIYERNKKTEKKKKKGKEKYENGPGENVSAQKQKQARGPSTLFPNRYPGFSLASLTCEPH